MSSNPARTLPAPTPENAITMQMQFQLELIKLIDHIAISLRSISTSLEKIANKQL